jgi:hypothetical protein
MDTYSLADLVEATGAKRRSIQLWADRRVINAVPATADAGTGVHRQFSRSEAIIACIIQAFALRQISIGELKDIAAVIRHEIRLGSERPALPRAGLIEAAVGGRGDTFLSYESWWEGGRRRWSVSVGEPEKGVVLYVSHARKDNHLCMAMRLETYLSKLK